MIHSPLRLLDLMATETRNLANQPLEKRNEGLLNLKVVQSRGRPGDYGRTVRYPITKGLPKSQALLDPRKNVMKQV